MNIINYILIRCGGSQQISIPVNIDITDVFEVQAVFDAIDRKYGDLGYSLVRGNPTFQYRGDCEITIYIDDEGVRVSSSSNNNYKRLKKEEFEDISTFSSTDYGVVWMKAIAINGVLDVIDCKIGLSLRYDVQVVETLAMKWQELNITADYDVVIQKTVSNMKVLFNPDVYMQAIDVELMEFVVAEISW